MESQYVWTLVSGFFHTALHFYAHPHCSIYQHFISFYGWIIFHCLLTLIYILFYPLVDRYLGCFHVLAIVNSAAMNMRVPVSFQISVSFFPDVYPGMELMDHMVLLLLVFWRRAILCHSGCPNLHSHQLCKRVLRENFLFQNQKWATVPHFQRASQGWTVNWLP